MTDEDLKNYNEKIIKHCFSCGSPNVSIRRAKQDEFIYGCEDCEQKNICDENMIMEAIETWNRRAKNSIMWMSV